jgi:hypothetical protein
MSPEFIGGWLLKVLAGSILAFFFWITRINHKKLQDTYTKDETEKQIKLMLAPIQTELSIKLESVLAATQEATYQRKETNTMLSQISEDLAVVKTEINHLKVK